MRRTDPLYTENIFRPVYEANIALAWGAGALATPALSLASSGVGGLAFSSIMSAMMACNAVRWGVKSMPLLKRHYRLHTNRMSVITDKDLRKRHQVKSRFTGKKSVNRKIFIGRGSKWGNEHANRAYQIMDFDSEHTDVKLPFALQLLLRNSKAKIETEKLGGSPWIHGIIDEVDQEIDEETLFGHSICFGNVGTGKTTFLRLLSVGLLHLGNVIIALDPKDDSDWREALEREAKWLGMGHRFFHVQPSKPSKSARMRLLGKYNRVTEIADRVAPLMAGSGSSKGFQDFAYSVIYTSALGLEYIGKPINLINIQQALTSSGRVGLAEKVLDQYFKIHVGAGWKERLAGTLERYGEKEPLWIRMVNYYYQVLKEEHGSNTAVEKIWELVSHDENHFQKMIVTLKPVLNALTAAPMDDIFSPTDDWESVVQENREEATRPIVDFDDLMEHGGVLYISLESLADGQTAGFLSRIIMAEAAAAAGRRYGKAREKGVTQRRVSVINDEVHASIENNDAMLNLLAMGRAAMFQLVLATQTRSDLLSSMANQGTADRFLGLVNNFFCMRTTDPATQEYAAKQFNKTSITTVQAQKGQSTDSSKRLGDFSTSRGVRAMKAREDAFPEALLGELPKLQYICKLADGRKLKMRLPVYINATGAYERAPWVQQKEVV